MWCTAVLILYLAKVVHLGNMIGGGSRSEVFVGNLACFANQLGCSQILESYRPSQCWVDNCSAKHSSVERET